MSFKILYKKDECFPKAFLKLKDCPEFIYVLGNEKILDDFSISIVGARKASHESKVIARNISKEIASNKVLVVSGLAVGIDSEAHRGALEVGEKTVAVLGNGLNKIYPRENKELAEEIIKKGGAIISECLPGVAPLPVNLNRRNRLIAALSEAIVIIEAKKKSGSLITAGYAKKQGKKLFVIPGGINDLNFEGNNQLLVDGAYCVRNSSDVFKCLNIKPKKSKLEVRQIEVPENLVPIYNLITKKGITFQEICNQTENSAQVIFTKLTLLEVSGAIKKSEGKFFKSRFP